MFSSLLGNSQAPETTDSQGSSPLAYIGSYFGYGQAQALRKLDEKTTFERIIAGITGDGFVYSSGMKSIAPKDGTAVLDYIKTIDPLTVNHQGTITLEQAIEAGLTCTEDSIPKVTLLEYFVHYFTNNPDKLDIGKLSTLLERGASFDIGLVEKGKAVGIDLISLWETLNQTDISKCKIDQVLTALEGEHFVAGITMKAEKLGALVYSYFYKQPIGNIFPDVFTEERLKNYTHLFAQAMRERLAAAQANLALNQSKTSSIAPDLTVSVMVTAIKQDTQVSESVRALTIEISKLEYALNAVEIKLASDELLEAEQTLTNLLLQKEEQSKIVKSLTASIEKLIIDIKTDDAKGSKHKVNLDGKKSAFSTKWGEQSNLTTEQVMERTQEAGVIASNQQLYTVFLEHHAKKQASLEEAKASLTRETEKLNQLTTSIASADATAKELAAQYVMLVQAKSYANPMGMPSINIASYKLESNETGLIKFLHSNALSMDQKGTLLFRVIQAGKWECICPLLNSGLLCEGLRSKNDMVITSLARQYNEKASPIIILALTHTSPEAEIVIKKGNIKDHCSKLFLDTPAFAHLVSGNNNAQEADKVNSK